MNICMDNGNGGDEENFNQERRLISYFDPFAAKLFGWRWSQSGVRMRRIIVTAKHDVSQWSAERRMKAAPNFVPLNFLHRYIYRIAKSYAEDCFVDSISMYEPDNADAEKTYKVIFKVLKKSLLFKILIPFYPQPSAIHSVQIYNIWFFFLLDMVKTQHSTAQTQQEQTWLADDSLLQFLVGVDLRLLAREQYSSKGSMMANFQ
jgi:hypothetical protein